MTGENPKEESPSSSAETQAVVYPKKEADRPDPDALKASMEPSVQAVEAQRVEAKREEVADAITRALATNSSVPMPSPGAGRAETISRDMRISEASEGMVVEYKTGDFDACRIDTLEVGMKLGQYRILEELGRGGIAITYIALDEKTGERVVVKILQSENAESVRRFMQEMVTMRLLRHKNIVRNIREGRTNKGVYLVMPYYTGGDLKEKSDEFPKMKRAEILSWCEQKMKPLMAAIHYLHGKGILHGDIKPSNIFIDKDGKLILGDLGLASVASDFQEPGVAIGTPIYAAPESMVDTVAVSDSSDWFSLGSSLYETLTGQHMYGDVSKIAHPAGAISKILEYRVNGFRVKPIREINPEVPEPIAAFIMQLIAAYPKDRIPAAQVTRRFKRAIEKSQQVEAPVENGKAS